MNKAITDGIDLMPPRFQDGLSVWSDQDGTPGSTTYDGSAYAAIAPSDSDFGPCLELVKTASVQKLRYMAETPLLPGCYLRVSARVKAISGNLPSVRVAGWAGKSGGLHVTGLPEEAAQVALTSYGEVVEVSAIIGAGNRTGVDLIWGAEPVYGHFGLDLTGATGGVVRIEDIVIEDITHVFHRKMMDWVDVRDYGAIGDGITDDRAAFEAADIDAAGREVLVSAGTYYLGTNMTFESPVRFEGTVSMPITARLTLTRNFELPSYIEAFGNEEEGLKRGLQALFNFTDHESLDMCGRRVALSQPLDVHAAVNNKDTFANRRVLRNGQLETDGGSGWNTEVFASLANFDVNSPKTLSNVAGISQIPVGSLVEGVGVGREIYVLSKNVAAATITLSQPLYGAPAQQSYTFKRFKYLLDFSGFTSLQRFNIADVEFLCQGNCSGVMLPPDGLGNEIRDCYFTSPLDRGVTSIGSGCSGLQLDRNQFLSNEQDLNVADRVSIGFNTNANDAKLRSNRAVRFKHFGVLHGAGNLIVGNHFFQGDNAKTDQRTAGLVLTANNAATVITGNYVDNCWIEWTNEQDATPVNSGGFSFGALTISGNLFYASTAPSWFRFIVIKPFGSDHVINGLSICNNAFKHAGGTNIDRVEGVDESFAPLDMTGTRNLLVEGNTYNGVTGRMFNPVAMQITQNADAQAWVADAAEYLPFGGRARKVVSVVAQGAIRNALNEVVFDLPYADPNLGLNGSEIRLNWSQPVHGTAYATIRADNPT